MSGQAYLTRLNAGRWGDIVASLGLLAATVFAVGNGRPGPNAFLFQLGPNDASYLTGFARHYEITDGVSAARWTSYDATIDLPVSVEGGPIHLDYRFWRVFPETAISEVYLDERLIDGFESRGGQTRLRRATLAAVPDTPVAIRFRSESHERKNLGLRLDWVALETGERARIRARGWALWAPALFATFLFALFRVATFERLVAIVLVAPWVATAAIWSRVDPFGFAYMSDKVLLCGMVVAAAAAWWLRGRDGGRWVLAIFVFGFVIKGAGLFLPSTFYPDVANARRYIDIYPETTGTLAERGIATQERTGVGYPRNIGGKDYAFPYSPLYFLPFTLFATPGAVEDAVRLVGLAAAAFQILAVFWLATLLFEPRVAVVAALLAGFMPPLFSRLVLALHATIVGHFLDLLVMGAVLVWTLKPESVKRVAVCGGATVLAFLVYTSSYFSLSLFNGLSAFADRRIRWRLLGMTFAAGTSTVLFLYWPFVWAFLTEMLPAVMAGPAGPAMDAAESPMTSPRAAFGRVPLFYGFVYPVLAMIGFLLARRRTSEDGYRFLVTYGLAFAVLLILRAFGGATFKDLKEITFVGPWIAVLSALTLVELSRRGRAGLAAAAVLSVWLVGFGVNAFRGYLATYASPLMVAERTGDP